MDHRRSGPLPLGPIGTSAAYKPRHNKNRLFFAVDLSIFEIFFSSVPSLTLSL